MKRLRDFTVAELEALPVGTRFVDRADDNRAWDFTKTGIGWVAPRGYGPETDASLLEFLEKYPYELDEPDPLRLALAPFANLAPLITDETPDDFALLRIGDAYLTAGDFRAAAKALESK